VNLIIAPFRSPKSAKMYQELWTENGSPLKYYGIEVTKLVQDQLGDNYEVVLAMRYQSPSIETALKHLKSKNLEEIIVIPLFPQYASATTGSVYEKVMDIVKNWQTLPAMQFVSNFFDHPAFIKAFTEIGRQYLEDHQYDHVIFSYHGIPERQIRKGDDAGVCLKDGCCDVLTEKNRLCYKAQCHATTRLLAENLALPSEKYTTCFQSRLGSDPWIKPYTEAMVKTLPKEGKKRVLAFSPAFVSDCLETTLEVGEEYKELFEEYGGEHWELVESLNKHPLWIETLVTLVKEYEVKK
ncbi:MAG: ferrochelatase, partial [Verrucomicrobia bacterium]|nr:ferrochelatase [Cytophagales bacterium]